MTTRRFVGTGALFLYLLCAPWHAPDIASAASVRIQEVFYDEVGSDGPGLFTELLGAAGLSDPRDLRPFHIVRREGPGEVKTYAEIYPRLPEGSLLSGEAPPWVMRLWDLARPDSFAAARKS